MIYSLYHFSNLSITINQNVPHYDSNSNPEFRNIIAPIIQSLNQLVQSFISNPVDPQKTYQFEQKLNTTLRECGRLIMEFALNRIESKQKDEVPLHVDFEDTIYTRMYKPTTQVVSTLFGKIELLRFGYRPTLRVNPSRSIFPVCQALGILNGVTAALREQVGFYQAEAGATQKRTLLRLLEDHNLDWGVAKLREVTQTISNAMSKYQRKYQVEKLLELLEKAHASAGEKKPVLSVGRDGITLRVPVKGGSIFKVASLGTVTVMDRNGKRLGTVYLGYIPEPKQVRMQEKITRIIEATLRRWKKELPLLSYVTDAGKNETNYYEECLSKMKHPRTGERLHWIRVVDFYHASQRVWKLAEMLFGATTAEYKCWGQEKRAMMKEPNGIERILRSAYWFRKRCQLKGKKAREFAKAYRYLKSRMEYMDYSTYKKLGIPRGSGVTEAACKTIFTQRLKCSGMRWKRSGAQTILNLRVILLSNIWKETFDATLKDIKQVVVPNFVKRKKNSLELAA
jgi:hypothetical protein